MGRGRFQSIYLEITYDVSKFEVIGYELIWESMKRDIQKELETNCLRKYINDKISEMNEKYKSDAQWMPDWLF